MNNMEYERLANSSCSWLSPDCDSPNFSSNLLDFFSSPLKLTNSFEPLQDCFSPVSSQSAQCSLPSQHSVNRCNQYYGKNLRKLCVLSLNACSLKSLSKRLEFQTIVDQYKPAITNVNETHLEDSVCSSEILDKASYTIFQRDRGVLSAFSNDLIVTCEQQLVNNYEGIWSKINIAGSKPLFVGSIYRPPSSDVEPLEALDHALSSYSKIISKYINYG